jgi:hypothetical protein
MPLAALDHTKMFGELTVFRAAVSSVVDVVLGRSPGNVSHVEVVGKLVFELHKLEDQSSRLERPAARICDLFLGPPHSRARLGDRLDEAAGHHRVELATPLEADAELEALQTLAA